MVGVSRLGYFCWMGCLAFSPEIPLLETEDRESFLRLECFRREDLCFSSCSIVSNRRRRDECESVFLSEEAQRIDLVTFTCVFQKQRIDVGVSTQKERRALLKVIRAE
ncbi:unnamed protein product [Enterobius vermicularis]|uniref:Secreted protein n=1 Tax=Enterobius vermicularis TaxID=51028 RepID=A0A0N4UW13_ENTVE|nr:unnamed protein product [Enterobius vermicularis]